jgi:uncharacterized protein YggE
MNRPSTVALIATLTGVPCLTLAQQAPAPTPETLLHLSASGSVQVAPDQLVADLVAQDTSPSAADAQRRVNALIAQGMQEARSVSSVDARTIGYEVSPADEKRTKWFAQQTLELRSTEGPALLDLANRLQQWGFVTTSLDWRLSPALRRKTYAEATTAALKAMQEQAASAAATLGLHIDHLKDVQLQPREMGPVRPMMAMAARVGAPAPQATAGPEEVNAEVSAEVILRP